MERSARRLLRDGSARQMTALMRPSVPPRRRGSCQVVEQVWWSTKKSCNMHTDGGVSSKYRRWWADKRIGYLATSMASLFPSQWKRRGCCCLFTWQQLPQKQLEVMIQKCGAHECEASSVLLLSRSRCIRTVRDLRVAWSEHGSWRRLGGTPLGPASSAKSPVTPLVSSKTTRKAARCEGLSAFSRSRNARALSRPLALAGVCGAVPWRHVLSRLPQP